jgi:hypothetical protein
MLGAEAHIGVRRHVEDDLGASNAFIEGCRIKDVSFDAFEISVIKGVGQELPMARRKIVVANDAMTLLEQSVDEIAADKSRGTSDKCPHLYATHLSVPDFQAHGLAH